MLSFMKALHEPWMIEESALKTILEIAARGDVDPENLAKWKNPSGSSAPDFDAVAARRGERMDGHRYVELRDGVAILSLKGPIFRYSNIMTDFSGAVSLNQLSIEFDKLMSMKDDLKGILIDCDTPGGVAAGIEEFSARIYAARGDIPIVAYVDNLAASAGYWIASACDEIVTARTGMVGSIGVVMGYFDHTDQLSKAGIKEVKFISSQSPLKQADHKTEAGRTEIQTIVDALAGEFITAVARNRGVAETTVLADYGQGGIKMGQGAVDAGMADRVSDFETILAEMAGKTAGQSSGFIVAAGARLEQESRKMENDKKADPVAENKPVTVDSIRASYPDIAASFIKEGNDTGYAAGVTAEKDRIVAIHNLGAVGHDDLVARCIADGLSAGDTAMKILAAETETRKTKLKSVKDACGENAKVETDLTESGEKPADANNKLGNLPFEDQVKADWDKDENIRAEFSVFETFLAYRKAASDGRVGIFSQKQ